MKLRRSLTFVPLHPGVPAGPGAPDCPGIPYASRKFRYQIEEW